MARPIIKKINAFDPSKEHIIEFVWNGNVAYNNKLVIYDAETTTSKVYEHKYANNHTQLDHAIPANILVANHKYAATIQTFDRDDIESQVSEKMPFWTVSIPKFEFDDLKINAQNAVKNASFGVQINYTSSTGDKLSWVKFKLYDANKILLTESSADYTPTLSYIYKGLSNNTSYYIQAVGETTKGLFVETPLVLLAVHYDNPVLYTQIQANADPQTGFVNYKSNLIVISPTKKNYSFSKGYIDLTASDTTKALNFKMETAISKSKPLSTSMAIHYTDYNGKMRGVPHTTNNSAITISEYRNLKKIQIKGNTLAHNISKLRESWTIENINACNLQINNSVYSNINDGFRLARIGSYFDELILSEDGQVQLVSKIEQFRFTGKTKAIKAEKNGNTFITYYDVSAKKGLSATDLICVGIPVGSRDATNITMDSNTGYVKITWYSDSKVTSEKDAQYFFDSSTVYIQYVLDHSISRVLTPRSLPPEIFNSQYLRYQDNISIPQNATFKFVAKFCRRTAPLLKVLSKNSSGFILSGLVNELDEFRLKLKTVGMGQTGVVYSDVIKCNASDILKVFIRRNNGLYQLKIQKVTNNESTPSGVWLSQATAVSNNMSDESWFDLTPNAISASDVSADSIGTQTANLPLYTVWIGDEEI